MAISLTVLIGAMGYVLHVGSSMSGRIDSQISRVILSELQIARGLQVTLIFGTLLWATFVAATFRRYAAQRRMAEQALQPSEARYRLMFENMGNAVAVYQAVDDGEDFVFRAFNRSAEGMEHVARGEVIGRSVLEAFPGVKQFGLFDVLQRVWRSGTPEQHPVSLYRDNRIAAWRENCV